MKKKIENGKENQIEKPAKDKKKFNNKIFIYIAGLVLLGIAIYLFI